MIKIGIIIPVHNCLDFTQEAIDSIKTSHTYQICVVDDHSYKPMKDWLGTRGNIITITDPEGSTGLAYNWNLGIKRLTEEGCTHFLVANNDILLHLLTIDHLVKRTDQGGAILVSAANINNGENDPKEILTAPIEQYNEGDLPYPDFSCFMITPRTIETIGWFDENFLNGYFEDNDYHSRIILSGNEAIKIGTAPYFHYGAKTLNTADVSKQKMINESFAHNAEYFQQKWGVYRVSDPAEMREKYYKTPFNDPNKTIKDW